MCGILGAVTRAASLDAARRMLSTLARRGPDGEGLATLDEGRVVLGHTRLAILDLTETGAQPMALAGADIWVTFNGEIYNHRELRGELETEGHRFRSTSDTEVLLAGYKRWGQDVLDKLDGIFAFGLWDGPRRRLWLARDHLGVKPLYYTTDPRNFLFASQPKALLAAAPFQPRPDRASINDMLSYGYIPGERSAYEGIAKLLPGHALVLERDALRTYRYWNVDSYASETVVVPDAAVARVERLVDDATKAQLESDVEVGVLVSGGIDSSAVTSAVKRARASLPGFVVGYDEPAYDERPYARALADHCGVSLHERVLPTQAAQQLLEELPDAYDEPLADSSTIPTLSVFQLVRDNRIKVVLGGDGGDELFSGYRRYDKLLDDEGCSQAPWPLKIIGARSARQAARFLARPARYRRPAWYSYYERIRSFSFAEQEQLLQPPWRARDEEELTWPFARFWRADLDVGKAAQVFDLHTYLPDDILVKVDRASMHYGVEARVPLLARRLVEYGLSVSTAVHRRDGRRKYLLKRMLEHRAPAELLSNRKKGFGLPLELAAGQALRDWLARIDDSALVRGGLLRRGSAGLVAGNLDKMWTLYSLDRWWSRWINP